MKKYKCKTCGKKKTLKAFSPHKQCKLGFDTSRCKACKKARWDWKQVPLEKKILHRIKARAKKNNIDFNLELSDIIIPEECPVFKRPFIYGNTDWTYSVDRIDPTGGYVKGNIQIISNKANRAKSNFAFKELEALVEFMAL